MPAAYDNYDYPAYWDTRDYEHQSEVVALKALLAAIPQISKLADIGAGYGRLTPIYMYRTKKSVLIDPSAKLLLVAREKLKEKRLEFVHSTVENLSHKLKPHQFDTVLMIGVMHHITDPDKVFQIINSLLIPGGYLILEFANKMHGKAVLKNSLRGNLTFPLDIFPQSKNRTKLAPLPFLNFHPDIIFQKLESSGFEIIARRSVSNIRSPFLKRHIPLPLLISLEKATQEPLAKFNFGPSVFVLARKK